MGWARRRAKIFVFFCLAGIGVQSAFSIEESMVFTDETVLERALARGIPSSFDDIALKIFAELGPGETPRHLVVPDGRSLQKKKADFKDPRLLVAQGLAGGAFGSPPRIFLGFAHKAKQAEAIVWNDRKGRYEFFVIEGVGGRPRVVRPPRSLCISCHQNEGPIFSRAPWSETDAPVFGVSPVDSQMPDKLKGEYRPKTRLQKDFFGPLQMDGRVRAANRALQAREICERLCSPDDLECKTYLLGAALRQGMVGIQRSKLGIPKSFDVKDSAEHDRFLGKYQASILKDGFARVSSVVPDRDPLDRPELGGTTKLAVPKNHRGDPQSSYLETYQEHNSGFGDPFTIKQDGKIEPQPGYETKEFFGEDGPADPKFPRPKVTIFYEGSRFAHLVPIEDMAKICFNLEEHELESLPLPEGDLIEYLQKQTGVSRYLASWPPPKEETMAFFRGEGAAGGKECADTPAQEPLLKQVLVVQELQAAILPEAQTPGHLFKKYCSECHEGFGGMISGYELPLGDAEAMARYGQTAGKQDMVREYLEKKKMPPASASRELLEDDRKVLLEFLKPAS